MPFDIEYAALWDAVCTRFPERKNDSVSVRVVSVEEITDLNSRYRNKNSATNVLTFSYTDTAAYEHDIALCIDVAEQEAAQRGVPLRDYIALLVVHAMLHAAGLDHEQSLTEDKKTRALEKEVLSECGFVSTSLSDVY
ncbi:MAG: rRNA maturation RNase YbeY [Candidatus Andersenbacteria bacterium RIFCSPHIGHO2_02_FULL_45_11]|uniref:Endoribonuclease YbeY n=1 Tax=Candidatus Andersenbacteria bacterium RIFCSPHIGHO2_12_FULL_45_11 TaxID=1797281 RepID=A0A1G1X313_9BACT|nr:MAG: rRNA maturation RNase YbeY [Candidatus Andersenbacteria bacterium RIFCSPHIGHO2_01_FULL_46_36]OGY32673.1 MAG: rRNA maturation RNase YbeY [Candidatus Andersenbacteria bacterium RIFCSPHIGHO2_02_FULL_45_11]OGY34412.1 MAG: rRNA maturation RNase YbeY [Candidatus Andersenbacteria bacterium RIFCSPHIGHO2_12_FULL_45_11]